MADDSDDEKQATQKVSNQPYDESLEVPDAEEVASIYSPSPRQPAGFPDRGGPGFRGSTRGSDQQEGMTDSDDEFETGPMENKGEEDIIMQQDMEGEHIDQLLQPAQPIAGMQQRPHPAQLQPESDDDDEEDDDDDDDDEESSEEDDDDDDDDNDHAVTLEGAYDPAEYENLPVNAEIKEMFQYITRYTPQTIDLEHKLKPFIPDYIPAVGDIDAFIKITRPDGQDDQLGLTVLDEPCAKQSDPTVLDLQLRALSKQTTTKAMQVRSIEDASKNPKMIKSWIESISDLHRSKPPPTVHYNKTMPDIDTLMQEWPGAFEDLLSKVGLPTADIDCTLDQYVEMICAILDIPIYQSKIQALHVIFTLFSEFKNSQHFKSLAADNKLDNRLKNGGVIDDQDGAQGDGGDDVDRLVF